MSHHEAGRGPLRSSLMTDGSRPGDPPVTVLRDGLGTQMT